MIVKTLSENKAFQQFALKTAKKGGQVVNSVKGKAEGAKLSDVRRPLAAAPSPARLPPLSPLTCAPIRPRPQKATGSVENAQAGLKGVFDWVASDLSKVGSKRK